MLQKSGGGENLIEEILRKKLMDMNSSVCLFLMVHQSYYLLIH